MAINSTVFIINSSLHLAAPKLVIDPTLDGRKEIANFNRLMDQIFVRMNLAIKVCLFPYSINITHSIYYDHNVSHYFCNVN